MIHYSLHKPEMASLSGIAVPKRSQNRNKFRVKNLSMALTDNSQNQPQRLKTRYVNGKRTLEDEKRQLLREGKLKLHNFLGNITEFENNLKMHRRCINDVIQQQKTVKTDIYERFKSLDEPKSILRSKNVNISTKNLSLTVPTVDCMEFKPAKHCMLNDRVGVKPLKSPLHEYIAKMTKMKTSDKQKRERESIKEHAALDSHRASIVNPKLSVLSRILRFKTAMGENTKMKGKVQMVLFNKMLFDLAKRNKVDRVKRILVKNTELVNTQSEDGATLLNIAIKAEFADMVKLLMNLRADVELVDNTGLRPLKAAYSAKNQTIFKVRL